MPAHAAALRLPVVRCPGCRQHLRLRGAILAPRPRPMEPSRPRPGHSCRMTPCDARPRGGGGCLPYKSYCGNWRPHDPRVVRLNAGAEGGGAVGSLAPKCPEVARLPLPVQAHRTGNRGDSAELTAQRRSAPGGTPGVPTTPPARRTNWAGPVALGVAAPRFRC